MSQPHKSSLALILLLYCAGLGAALQFAKLATSFDLLRDIYPASETFQGLLVSIISFVGILLGVVAGQLVASLGYRRMLVAGLTLGAAMSFVQAFLPAAEIFMASRILEGLSHLAIVVAAPTLISQVTRPDQRYLSMTLWSSFFGVAFAIAALITPGILNSLGFGALIALHGVYMAAIAVLLWLFLPKATAANASLPSVMDMLARHKAAYSSPNEAAAAFGWLFYTLTFVSILTVLPPLLPAESRAWLTTLMPIASILSSFTLGAWLLKKLSAVRVVQIGFLIGALFALLILILPPNGGLFILLFAALGLIQSSSFAVVPELNDTAETQAHANGAMAQMGNLGNTLGTPVMLVCMIVWGNDAIPVMVALAYLAGWGMHSYLARLRARGV